MSDELLTPVEHELIELLGRCARLFADIALHPDDTIYLDDEDDDMERPVVAWDQGVATDDVQEAVDKIHQLQHAVAAQAAARAYPDRYRLLGARLP